MNKQQILAEKLELVDWCVSLKGLEDDIWFTSFPDGAWGIADVISHFISWDKFLIDYRIPYLVRGEEFPTVGVNVQSINDEAMKYARSGISKEELIDECVQVRKDLVALIKEIPEEKFTAVLRINNNELRLKDYFTGLIEHDHKHMSEIDAFIETHAKL